MPLIASVHFTYSASIHQHHKSNLEENYADYYEIL